MDGSNCFSHPIRGLSYQRDRGYGARAPPARAQTSKVLCSGPFAIRKPRDHRVTAPGELVQIDTVYVRPMHSLALKHPRPTEPSRAGMSRNSTATSAAGFLEDLLHRTPPNWPKDRLSSSKPSKMNGGTDFKAAFERACQLRHVQLFGLPPRSRN